MEHAGVVSCRQGAEVWHPWKGTFDRVRGRETLKGKDQARSVNSAPGLKQFLHSGLCSTDLR